MTMIVTIEKNNTMTMCMKVTMERQDIPSTTMTMTMDIMIIMIEKDTTIIVDKIVYACHTHCPFYSKSLRRIQN